MARHFPTDSQPDREPTDHEPNDHEPADREPNDHEPNDREPADREPADREPAGDDGDVALPLTQPDMSWVLVAELAVFAIVPVMDLSVPSVLPMLAIASLALWLSGKSWGDVGLVVGRLYPHVAIGFGVVLGALTLVADVWLWGPALQLITGEIVDLNHLPPARGNAAVLIYGLTLAWAGAFAAEMVFRGYLLDRLEGVLGTRGAGAHAALVLAALAYGWMLAMAQPGGMAVHWVGGAIMGVGYGLLYRAGQRNLILPIAFHGTFETTNLVLIYLKLI